MLSAALNFGEARGRIFGMAKRKTTEPGDSGASRRGGTGRPSALIDTRVIYCGNCLDQLRNLPDGCIDRLYLWHRFPTSDSHRRRNYEVFWGRTSEPRAPASGLLAPFEDRHASTQAHIDYMRPRCVKLPAGIDDKFAGVLIQPSQGVGL